MAHTVAHTAKRIAALVLASALVLWGPASTVQLAFAAGGSSASEQAASEQDTGDKDTDKDSDDEKESTTPVPAEPTRIKAKAYEVTGSSKTWNTSKESYTISDLGGQLRIAVTANRRAESPVSETDTDPQTGWKAWGVLSEGFTYELDSAGKKCLEFAQGTPGLFTAKADGTATITVKPVSKKYRDMSSKFETTVEVKVINQSTALQVTDLEIVDKNGKAYGDDNLKLASDSEITKLYARVTYKDKAHGNAKVVYANYPGAPSSQTPADKAFDTLEWKISNDEYASISTHKDGGKPGVGYLKGTANAMIQVYASITGADASKSYGMGYGVMVDKIGVNIQIPGKAGRVNGEDPADKLTVNVVYEKDPDTLFATQTYTVAQFEKLGAVTRYYTLTRSGGKFVTDKAYGVPIATLLKALKVDTNDVNYFTMAANDGANPGKITAKWLLKTTRYYLPNYDLGGSWQEKEQTPSMIAVKDSWNSDTTLTGDLNSGTRFRLMFGASTASDNATDKSIKFINTLTVVMKGAPPSRHGKDDKDAPAAGTKTDPDRSSKGPGDNGGAVSGNGDGNGQGNGQGDGGSGNNPGPATSGAGGKTIGPASAAASDASVGASDMSVQELDQSTAWRIYQMMNNSNSDLTPIGYEDNPYEPFALPSVVLVLLLAGAWRAGRFKKQLGS